MKHNVCSVLTDTNTASISGDVQSLLSHSATDSTQTRYTVPTVKNGRLAANDDEIKSIYKATVKMHPLTASLWR